MEYPRQYIVRLGSILTVTLGLTLSGCASKVQKADIPATANPQEEISRLEGDLKSAQASDVDVLAFKDYDKSIKYLEEAKSDLAGKQSQDEVLDDLRYGRAHLNAARAAAEHRRGRAPNLLDARQAALTAGAAQYPELGGQWKSAEEAIKDDAEDLSKLKTDKISALQAKYVDLERQATTLRELGKARAQISGAQTDGAMKKAPRTLQTAELDEANAESLISTNVRNPAGYQAAVTKANVSAQLLTDVMNTIRSSGAKNLPEATAISMVQQGRQLSDLKTDLSLQRIETAATATAAAAAARSQERELEKKDQALRSAQQSVAIQQALEKARSEFSPAEAEAYQQGNDLVIRLKTVNFPSGRADLPTTALPTLAKISEVAKGLDAEKIRVEGHTDSVGGEATNQQLSEKRADAVATYLKSNGFGQTAIETEGLGLTKPLASNKSRAGRAQNRRVDIVITPKASADAGSSSIE